MWYAHPRVREKERDGYLNLMRICESELTLWIGPGHKDPIGKTEEEIVEIKKAKQDKIELDMATT